MAEIEIGLGKSARRAFSLDEISIVPSRRTRDSKDVDVSWEIDAYKFDLPMMVSGMDSALNPATAIEIGRLGGCGIFNLEGIYTRYEDTAPILDELAGMPEDKLNVRLKELYTEPIKPTLMAERISEIKQSGVITAASISPGLIQDYAETIGQAELDLLVIQGAIVSAEHVSRTSDPFNMKQFVREFSLPVLVGDCASYPAALHLMRTGAAGVLVGDGAGGARYSSTALGVGVPQATAIADARAARMRHLDETGVYCQVIAHGGMNVAGDIAKAFVCGADAVMLGTPLISRIAAERPLAVVTREMVESLRISMATTGYESLKAFQKAEIVTNNRQSWPTTSGATA